MAEDKNEPRVSVHGIPKSEYDSSGNTQEGQQGGLKGHLQKYGMFYLIGIGVVTIIVIMMFNKNNSDNSTATDPYGYGTGNSSASDTYGAQLDSDYQMMQNAMNQNNALLQSLLTNKTKTSTGDKDPGKKKGGSGGSGGNKKKKITTSKPGGNTGGSSKGHSGHVSGGHKSTSVSHSTISHSAGKSTVVKKQSTRQIMKPNPSAGGAHGWVYTASGGENLQNLFDKAWPGKPSGFGFNYANNAQLIKGMNSNILKKGQKIIL